MRNSGGVALAELKGAAIRYAQCCQPVPGDPIVGYITRGRGVTVHREDCRLVSHLRAEPERLWTLQWDKGARGVYAVALQATVTDRRGMLSDLTAAITACNVVVKAAEVRPGIGSATARMIVEIHGPEELEHCTRKLLRVDGVHTVKRAMGSDLSLPQTAASAKPPARPTRPTARARR